MTLEPRWRLACYCRLHLLSYCLLPSLVVTRLVSNYYLSSFRLLLADVDLSNLLIIYVTLQLLCSLVQNVLVIVLLLLYTANIEVKLLPPNSSTQE